MHIDDLPQHLQVLQQIPPSLLSLWFSGTVMGTIVAAILRSLKKRK